MARINRPTKEQVRVWLAERRQHSLPLPSCEQIRSQLGWEYSTPDVRHFNQTEQEHHDYARHC
ncbi:MAG TPA: hypothetical protein VF774_19660 [Pseudoduganella sp.]